MKRLIFTLLYSDGYFFLSRNFRLQKIGNIKWIIDNYNFTTISRYLDELMILNVSRNQIVTNDFLDVINILSKNCFIPVTVGGNIHSKEIANDYMKNGADKILINSLAYNNPKKLRDLLDIYGKANIIGCVDFIENKKNDNQINVVINQGKKIINENIYDWIKYLSDLEVGEILLQSVDNDGTGKGLYNKLDQDKILNISLPIILMGGIGNYEHIIDGFKNYNVNAIATANILNFIGNSFYNTRNLLLKNNIELPNWEVEDFNNLKNILNEK